MNAQRQAQRQFESQCDCCPPEADPVELTDEQLADIDVRASEELDEGTYPELFAVLADASDSWLVKRLAHGDAMPAMSPRQLDVFAKFARLADRMADVRAVAIAKAQS